MDGWSCLSCDSGNPAGTRWCGHCGVGRADTAELWSCTSCGAANVLAGRYCGQCGSRHSTTPQVEERREVTALFADISGFTTLADQLDDAEALHDIINPVIAGMAAIAERYEGFVAKYAGDALLVFFGAPVAHEDDAARALHVALEMHSALPALLDTLPPEGRGLTLHIGVNTGRVISGQFGGDLRNDYSILGDSVILAQRLESVAPSGSTFVGQRTRDLVADQFRFEWMGELELKGKLAAVPAWRLVGLRQGPGAGAAGGQLGPLVGRGAELELVDASIASLASGRGGGTVTVTGEPGVGKTRLLQEARNRAETAGLQWIQVRIPSFGASLTYWPFAEIARAVAGIRVDHDAVEARRRLAAAPGVDEELEPHLARLLGLSRPEEVGGVDPEQARSRLHRAMVDWLLRIGDGRATVFVIEDVHWMDRASIDLAAELARATQGWPVALVVTARPEGLSDLERIADRVDASFHAHFALGPLDRDGIAELLTALLEGEPPEKLVEVASTRSGGNPLFVTELVRTLLDEQTLAHGDGGWRMRSGWTDTAIPDTVERLLSSRIDLLESEPAAVLSSASVVGRLVRLPLLRAIDATDGLDHHLDTLVQAGFLDPTFDDEDTAFLFHHALVQEVAYERLLRRRRVELHRTLAENAEVIYGAGDDVVELLARHSYLGERGPVAAAYCARAGRRAASLYANDEAIGHLERAVEVAAPDDRPVLERQLGEVHNLVGNYDLAFDLYRDAARAGDIAAVIGQIDILRKRGDSATALELVDAALDQVPDDDDQVPWLHYQKGRVLVMLGRGRAAADAFAAGLEAGDPISPAAGRLKLELARAQTEFGEYASALENGRAGLAVFESLGDLGGQATAHRVIGDTYEECGQLEDAAASLRRGFELARRSGHSEEVAAMLINLGMLELELGNLTAAIQCDRQAILEFERMDHGPGLAIGHGNLAEKLVAADDLAGAETHGLRALEKANAIGQLATVADVEITLADLRQRQGRLDEALTFAETAADRLRSAGLRTLGGASLERAEALVDRLRASARPSG